MATNLELINATYADFGVATIDINDVFSDHYDTYRVVLRTRGDGNNKDIRMRFKTTSGVDSTLNYQIMSQQLLSYSTPSNVKYNQSSIIPLLYDSAFGGGYTATIYKPYDSSSYTYYTFLGGGEYSSGQIFHKSQGFQTSAQQVTGFQILTNTGTMYDTTIQVYGVR